MLHKMPALLVLLVLSCPTLSHAGLLGPSNYDECITDSMKGVSSDVAARAIIESCRNLFPDSRRDAAPEPAPPAENTATAAAAGAATVVGQATVAADPAPLDTTGARKLTADELARLRAKAKVFGSSYRVTIDNGNSNLTLTEVTIAVWDDADHAAGRKEYSEQARIAPQTSAEVKYTVHYRGDETGWSWDVVAARGVE